MREYLSFDFESHALTTKQRIDDFIEWAEPGGTAGFESHRPKYDRKDPFFAYSDALLPHSHKNTRSWFVRQEYLQNASAGQYFSRARGDTEPEIKNPLALIRPGRFLSFAKAYLNVYCVIRRLDSIPKSSVRALIFLEKALRGLNGGDNDPSNLSHVAFHRAALALQRSKGSRTVAFDSGKALEHMALLLQAGGRFKGDQKHKKYPGFKLLGTPFAFRSAIKSPPRFGKKRQTEAPPEDKGHLTSEEVAAIGLAYRRAREEFGPDGMPTYYAGLMGLSLTTASMRPSDLQALRHDALYPNNGRYRLRVPRPKISIEQDVPVSKKLGPLAAEIFDVVRSYTSDARAAFKFYISQAPNDIQDVHTLFIPDRIKPLLKSEYLNKEQMHEIINPDATSRSTFPQRLNGKVPVTFFVEKPGDIFGKPGKTTMVRIRDLIEACDGLPVDIKVPVGARRDQFVHNQAARRLIGANAKSAAVQQALRKVFSGPKARRCRSYISRDDLLAHLLAEFKRSEFPHWPYTTNEKSVRLDAALAVHFRAEQSPHLARGASKGTWWLPTLLSIQVLNAWVAGNSANAPVLFSLLEIRHGDGSFPSVSVQRSRRYHHTAALIAGVSPLFANQLAGRESGWAGESYDYRTPSQIVKESIDTYDPDQDSDFIGPIADQAPSPARVLERKIFLAENAAPKQFTEIGGCRSDLALDPCEMFGDCMRCGQHLWRKGDQRRLPRINDMRDEAARIIQIAGKKLRKNPRLLSIEKHLRQKMEILDRCDFILGVEADPAVKLGTIVTFSPAPTALSSTELRSRLRKFGV